MGCSCCVNTATSEPRLRCEVIYCCLAICVPIIIILVSIGHDASDVAMSKSGVCPLREFSCGVENSTVCVPQEQWCDGEIDCPNGKDEDDDVCLDEKGYLPVWRETCFSNDLIRRPLDCGIGQVFPTQCVCRYHALNCSDASLTSIPNGIPHNVTKLFLKFNQISVLDPEELLHFSELTVLHLRRNFISQLKPGNFQGLIKLEKLSLSYNNLSELLTGTFDGLNNLMWLVVDHNRIRSIEKGTFDDLHNLCLLRLPFNEIVIPAFEAFPAPPNCHLIELQYNHIEHISNQTFKHMKNIAVLLLEHNQISTIDQDAFHELKNITDLDLSNNLIKTVTPDLFSHNTHLVALTLANNPITEFKRHTFDDLQNLQSLNLSGLRLKNVHISIFSPMANLSYIYFSTFELCRFTPQVRMCEPKGDGISSFSDLLGSTVLRVFVWIVGATTCLANLVVLVCRMMLYEERNVPTMFIKNLAVSDFLMGVFLLNVGAHDLLYRGHYNRYAFSWMGSWDCQTGGILAMLSSEASILILTVMSVERYLVVAFPYQWKGLTMRTALMLMAAIWTITLALSFTPLIPVDMLYDFYGSNGVCFPLHIHDPFMTGYQYSALIFLGINGTAFVIMLVCYFGMFCSIRRTQHLSGRKVDMSISKRLFLLVFTDALCWVPIMVIKTLAFAQIHITDEFYAWLAIFVLPVNSSLNPILYSISTPAFKRNLHDHMPDRLISISLTKRGTSLSTSNGQRPSLTDKQPA